MKRLAWPLWAVALALAGAMSALAADQPSTTTTYRWVDAQGVVHYSDTPQPGAEKLQIQPAQTYRSPTNSTVTAGRITEPAAGDTYQACGVSHPTAEQSFFAPDEVSVSVNLTPALRADDQLSVTMDGAPLQPLDDSALHYRVSQPDRGSHTLSVTVHDAAGNVVCNSSAVTFYVERPSKLSPQSPARGNH